jgi:hypothetical protein
VDRASPAAAIDLSQKFRQDAVEFAGIFEIDGMTHNSAMTVNAAEEMFCFIKILGADKASPRRRKQSTSAA